MVIMPGKQSYVHKTAEKYFLFDNASFLRDLKCLNTFLSFQDSDSFYKDIERTDDINRVTKEIIWKERFIVTSRNRQSSKRQVSLDKKFDGLMKVLDEINY